MSGRAEAACARRAPAPPAAPAAPAAQQPPGMLLRLFGHFSNYSLGSLLVSLASLISFPILTRVFPVAEYGVIALVNSTLGLLVGCGKFGVQYAIVRFYAEVEGEGETRAQARVEFFTTVLLSMTAIGSIVAGVAALAFAFMPDAWWHATAAQYLVALAAPLILIRSVDSGVLNLLRAQHRSRFYGVYTALRKYLGLGFVLAVLLLVSGTTRAFFLATMVAETAALAVGVAVFLRQGLFRWRAFSPSLLRSMLAFGMPLFASGAVALLLGVAMRYLVNLRLGPTPLGVFSAASNLAESMVGMFAMSFAIAVEPMYFRQWEQQGAESTRVFLERAFKGYLLLACPMLAGMTAIGPQLLALLAPSSYRASAALIFLLVASMLVAGAFPIVCAGVNLRKMTRVVLGASLASAVSATLLAIWALPRWGIEGAAAATLLASLQYSAIAAWYGRKVVAVPLPWRDLARCTLASVLMAVVVLGIDASGRPGLLALQVVVGVALYALLMLGLDADLRRGLRHWRGA